MRCLDWFLKNKDGKEMKEGRPRQPLFGIKNTWSPLIQSFWRQSNNKINQSHAFQQLRFASSDIRPKKIKFKKAMKGMPYFTLKTNFYNVFLNFTIIFILYSLFSRKMMYEKLMRYGRFLPFSKRWVYKRNISISWKLWASSY